ncbi:MAG: hypothetical protein NDI66_07845, partial [Pseudomonas sp.]|nr:hypothetical protein [Pseudomonas sp.]
TPPSAAPATGRKRLPGSNRATSASPAPQFGQQQQALPRSAVVLQRWRFEVPPALAWWLAIEQRRTIRDGGTS